MTETVIKNDFQGLSDYFTAPNIRRKIRHPIFLAVKFSNCVKFFYNKSAFPSSSLKEILALIQSTFDNEEEALTRKLYNLALLQIIPPDNYRLEDAKRIADSISLPESLHASFRVILNNEPIPSSYVMVTCMEEFANAAIEVFGDNESSCSSRSIRDSSAEDRSTQEIILEQSFPSEPELGKAMGLFPLLNTFIREEQKQDVVEELLRVLANVANSEGPLNKELPLPYVLDANNESSLIKPCEANSTMKSSVEF
eukprot:TRINITY_DN7958_c0_g1_i12.p1 TRINITY_DN7958_c0_g1~~TRINITY_DN7958_c0_g1_i12.p1  ORF type:complete len:254 (-),score=77.47 TRINITY_DN7958_c0_g1_i12:254-1015(-)